MLGLLSALKRIRSRGTLHSSGRRNRPLLRSSNPLRTRSARLEILESRCLLNGAPLEGFVWKSNPIQELGDDTLVDNNDVNYQALNDLAIADPVNLNNLDGSGLLKGAWVDVATHNDPALPNAVIADLAGYRRDDPQFEQVLAYYTIDRVQEYIQTLGLAPIREFPTMVDVHFWPDDDKSAFFPPSSTNPTIPENGILRFGDGGADDAEDADVIIHEYAHALQYSQNTDIWGGEGDIRAMQEGFADYLAASFLADEGDPTYQGEPRNNAALVGEWGLPSPRRVDVDMLYSNRAIPDGITNNDEYINSAIWSRALWDIRRGFLEEYPANGQQLADALILSHHFTLPKNASMLDAANEMMLADGRLYGGANQGLLEAAFNDRGIEVTNVVGIDLVAGSLEVNRRSLANNVPFSADFTLINRGDTATDDPVAAPFNVRFYLSDDQTIDGTDYALELDLDPLDPDDAPHLVSGVGNENAYRVVTPISAYEARQFRVEFIPKANPFALPTDGDYFILMDIDADGEVGEAIETNNREVGLGKDTSRVDYKEPATLNGEKMFVEDWQSGWSDAWQPIRGTEGEIEIYPRDSNDPNGDQEVILDDLAANDTPSLNQLILHINLDGEQGVVLRYDNRHWGVLDGLDGNKNVLDFSIDGGRNWIKITSLDKSSEGYETLSEPLDGLLPDGEAFSDDTLIRFRQFGYSPTDEYVEADGNTPGRQTAGIGLDNITILAGFDGPAVIQHTVTKEGQITTDGDPTEVVSVVFKFDEPIDTDRFDADFLASKDNVIRQFLDPSGDPLSLNQITAEWRSSTNEPLDNMDTLELFFNPQSTPGMYKLVIGPGIYDKQALLAMNQDGNQTAGEPGDSYEATFTITRNNETFYATNMDDDPDSDPLWSVSQYSGAWDWFIPDSSPAGGGGTTGPDPTSGFNGGRDVYGVAQGDYEPSNLVRGRTSSPWGPST